MLEELLMRSALFDSCLAWLSARAASDEICLLSKIIVGEAWASYINPAFFGAKKAPDDAHDAPLPVVITTGDSVEVSGLFQYEAGRMEVEVGARW
jgi:hypothetical protein